MASGRSGPSSPTRLVVGNDVVDLSHPRCRDMPLDGRFVERVLADREREQMLRAARPRWALWRMWAAKEAAYKVISKRLGSPPPFEHARFVVTVEDGGIGRVTWSSMVLPFREEEPPAPDVVHVVAWDPDDSPDIEAEAVLCPPDPPPEHQLGRRERAAVHSPASAWVRVAARARAAALLDVPEAELEIVCDEGPPGRTAPRLLASGSTASWDVSLSHHGRWVAWALGRSKPQGRKLMSRDVPKRE